MSGTITITYQGLQAAIAKWVDLSRDGKAMPPEQAAAMTAEEQASVSAQWLWKMLGGNSQES
jgi:hypothetical protein